jgi:hypothetical protein
MYVCVINTYLDTRNIVSHGEVRIVTATATSGRAHAVLIVLAHEYEGQLPQGGHVGGFPDLSLIGCSITKTGDSNVHGSICWSVVLASKGKTSTHRHLLRRERDKR